MKTTFKALMIAVAILVMGVTVSLAQDFEKGLEAYLKGDYTTTLSEFRPLAEQGNASAQYNLGMMYANGQGVTQDYAEAVNWYRKAAEQGDDSAQSNLGLMYVMGKGVTQDNVYAHMWWNIAASNGIEKAEKNRDRVAKEMTASQVGEAQKLARECVQKNYKGC